MIAIKGSPPSDILWIDINVRYEQTVWNALKVGVPLLGLGSNARFKTQDIHTCCV